MPAISKANKNSDLVFAKRSKWLPDRTTQITKTISEIIACYLRIARKSVSSPGARNRLFLKRTRLFQKENGVHIYINRSDKSVKLNPDYYFAWYELGVVYQAQGKNVAAKQAFKRAIKINPEAPNAVQALEKIEEPND